MSPAGPDPSVFAVIALILSSFFAPLGVPPLPPDAAILRAAPEECLLFASSAGTAQPDAASENHTDQLLATAEVQTFLSQCGTQLTAAIQQYGQRDPQLQPMVELGKPLVETLLSRPAAFYVESFDAPPGAVPSVVAGLIVNCGERKAEVAKAIEALEKAAVAKAGPSAAIEDAKVAGVTLRRVAAGPGVEIHWGFKDDYFVAAIGPKAAADLLARMGGTAAKPRWMAALEKQAAVKRISTIRYLDVARLIATATASLPKEGFDVPAFLDAAGLANLTSIADVAGFSTRGMVDRTIANFNGPPKGLFELFAGKPLAADDLKPIPSTAGFAVALRLDPLQVYQKVTDLAEKVNPKSVQQFKQTAAATLQAFGFRLEEDVLGSFGDVWTLHNVVSSGPDQLAGLTATVTVKNKAMLGKIQTLALGMIKAQGAQLPFSISETKIGDVPAWRVVPVKSDAASPAWAIAGDRLVVAGSLEALKTQITQPADSAGLGELPAVASRLKTDPVWLTYQDIKAIVEGSIALLRMSGPMGTALLEQQGIKVEMPEIPDYKLIAAHVLPRTSTLRVSKQSIISEAFETVPLAGSTLSSAPAAGVMIGMLLPAVQAAREAARNSQSKSGLKQDSAGGPKSP